MKCLTDNELELFVLENDPVRRAAVEAHLNRCSGCRQRYAQKLAEQEEWAQQLFSEPLPADFTEKLMEQLEHEEIERTDRMTLEENELTVPRGDPSSGLPPRSTRRTAKRRRWIIAAVTLLLFLTGTLAAMSSPTVAQLVRSLFNRDYVDIGLLNAQEHGLVQHPGVRVKSKGYTVLIDEAVADPTRVVVALQLFGPDGKHDRNRLTLTDPNSIVIKDEKGNVVGKLYDYGLTNDFYYMIAFFPEPLQSDKITIEGRLSKLGNEIQNIPSIEGDWNFDFTIDMKEAKSMTTIVPLQGEYTSPDGMTVRLKRLTRMVQGVRLELDTELSSEALARSPGDGWQKQGLKFHFENMAGEEIHSVNTRKVPHMDSLMTHSKLPGAKPGVMHWSYTFKYLPTDIPYRFVFDGYFIAEQDGTVVDFVPSELKANPVPFQSAGDVLTLRNFTIEKSPEPGSTKVEGSLHLDGRLINEYHSNEWVVQDQAGITYNAEGRGSISGEDGYLVLGGGSLDGLFEYRIAELSTVPERLKLIRTIVNKVHSNVNWSVLFEPAQRGQ